MSWIAPDLPALPPPVKLYAIDAAVQLANVTVPVPTAVVVGFGAPVSNTPPVVSYSVTGIDRIPVVNAACAVYHRCPAAPAAAPFAAYVYQVTNSAPDKGFASITNPCPDVAASYQLPEKPKSGFVVFAAAAAHVTFCVSRVSGTFPLRPLPSLNV